MPGRKQGVQMPDMMTSVDVSRYNRAQERSKNYGILILAATSACQTLIGCFSAILGVSTFLYCGVCARNFISYQSDVCAWTLTSQGIWTGCVVFLSGLAGIVQACIGKRGCNLTVLILSSTAAFVSLLATGLDVARFLDIGWFRNSVHEFRSLCLDSREVINNMQWEYYNLLSVSIGGCCVVLCFLVLVVAGCIHCRYSSRTGNERQRGSRSRSDGYEPLPPPYSRLEDTSTTLSFSSVVTRTTGHHDRERSSRDCTLISHGLVESQPTVDDLICLTTDRESPSPTLPLEPDVVETHLRPTQGLAGDCSTHTGIQTVTFEGDQSLYAITARVG